MIVKQHYSSTLIWERDFFWCSFTYWFNNKCFRFSSSFPVSTLFFHPSPSKQVWLSFLLLPSLSTCPPSLHSLPPLSHSDHCPAPACAYCSSHGGNPASVCPSEGHCDASLLISGVTTLACTPVPVSTSSPGKTECARSLTESLSLMKTGSLNRWWEERDPLL